MDTKTTHVTPARTGGLDHSPLSPLAIHDLSVAYQRKAVLWDIDLEIPPGKLIGLIGPNGAGKSTLLKAALGLTPVTSGEILIYGQPFNRQRHLVGYVPQRESVDWDFPVSALDVVTMGRYRQIGWLRPVRKVDRDLAMQALERVGIAQLAHRQIGQLSGGQQQRTFLARALMQEASLYLMDEPFAAVDAATEKAIVQILQQLRSDGKTVLVVHHDLHTVADYFDHIILLNMRVVATGPTTTTFTADNLKKTYGGKLTLLDQIVESLTTKKTNV